jgi:flagellar basal body-associated protein FliL
MYRMGGIVLMVALVVCAAACGVLKFWLWKLNQKAEQRDREQNEGRETFRYVL